MDYRTLILERRGPVARVTLNRPNVRNAFNRVLVDDLTAWAEQAATRDVPRVAVLAGAGPVFSAGADLTWMSAMIAASREENLADARALAGMFQALDALPFALIGRIHGAALGGGAGLVAICDIAVADEAAVFAFSEVKLGLVPSVIAPYVLAKIGRSAARELFLTGGRFSAKRALEIGLVHATAPAAELDTAVDGYVEALLTSGPDAVAVAKALIPRIWGCGPAEAAAITIDAIATRRVSPEGQAGMRAFLEKRQPPWVVPQDEAAGRREH
jgi:methylglutaconyl-CoA hydratase